MKSVDLPSTSSYMITFRNTAVDSKTMGGSSCYHTSAYLTLNKWVLKSDSDAYRFSLLPTFSEFLRNI